jgi:signal transduction histidine kinase
MTGKKVSKSIFIKLIFIIVLYGVLINIAVALFVNFSKEFKPKKNIHKIFIKLDDYILKDLGVPPDTVKAKIISDELGVNIRFRYKDFNWTTSNEIPPIEELSKDDEFSEHFPGNEPFTMHYKDKTFGVSKIPDGVFVLSYITNQDIFNPEKAVLALVVLLSAIFIPLYFLLRWLFNPLKLLSDAVKQIGEGNYNIKFPVGKSDEFGDLARSLSEMSARVKDSIRAKEQLLIDVSHELRTPLTRIKFGLELGTPKETINEDVMEIENMIKKILEYYRNEYYYLKVDLIDIEIVPVIEDVISSFDLQRNRIEFINYLKNKKNILIKADDEKLKIAFKNIISNALKFSPDNKNVIVSVNEFDKYYEICFKDFGEGIEEEEVYKIFEPFSRIDSSRSKKTGGYGLGLAIVKKILDLHNASVEVKSKIDEGTEFIIKFKKT